MKKWLKKLGDLILEILGLSSSRGRVIFFVLVSTAIFLEPPAWPITFSVWQHLGIEAPSIGLTRAYRYVLHGEFVQAWQQNKLIFVVIVVGGAVIAKDMLTLLRKYKKVAPITHVRNRGD